MAAGSSSDCFVVVDPGCYDGDPECDDVDPGGYDGQAWAYHESVESSWRQRIEHCNVMRLLGDLRGLVVVDVGCGTGRLSRAARDSGAKLVHAVDPSAGMLDVAQSLDCRRLPRDGDGSIENVGVFGGARWDGAAGRGSIRYERGCAEHLGGGLAIEVADVVLLSLVLHHLNSRHRVLRALRRAHASLKHGGRLVGANSCLPASSPAEMVYEFPRASCSMPHGNEEWREIHVTLSDPSVVRLTIFIQRWETLRELLEEAGFRCIERHEPEVDRELVERLPPSAKASLKHYLVGLALFTATK